VCVDENPQALLAIKGIQEVVRQWGVEIIGDPDFAFGLAQP